MTKGMFDAGRERFEVNRRRASVLYDHLQAEHSHHVERSWSHLKKIGEESFAKNWRGVICRESERSHLEDYGSHLKKIEDIWKKTGVIRGSYNHQQ